MSLLVPYSPQPQSYTCSAWESINTSFVKPTQWALNIVAFASRVLSKVGIVAEYAGSNHLTQRMSRSSVVALIASDMFVGVANVILYSSKYYQIKSCAHYEIGFQQKKEQVSLKLIELIQEGKKKSAYLTSSQQKSYRYLSDNYKSIYTNLSNSQSSSPFILAGASMLKKYFPNETRLNNISYLDLKQIEKYFEILTKKIASNEIKVTSSEKSVINFWSNLFEVIK